MRIITGEYRGRKLETPVGYDVRPTTDKVKEALELHQDSEGRRIASITRIVGNNSSIYYIF